MEDQRLSMRLKSCREALQAITHMLRQSSVGSKVLHQMQQLETLMAAMDTNAITESDMLKVESASNRLFHEFKRMFRQKGLDDPREREKLH